MRYRSLRVCSLGEWAPQLHTGLLVSGATQALPQTASSFSYRALTVCGGAFQAPSDRSDAKSLWRMTVRPGQAYNPRAATPVSLTRHEFRRPPVRSPLLRGCFLFLGVREMFQFPRFPPRQMSRSSPKRWGCPIRRSWAQCLLAAPPRVSSQCHVLHRHAAPRHPPVAHSVFPGGTLDAERKKLAFRSVNRCLNAHW